MISINSYNNWIMNRPVIIIIIIITIVKDFVVLDGIVESQQAHDARERNIIPNSRTSILFVSIIFAQWIIRYYNVFELFCTFRLYIIHTPMPNSTTIKVAI